MSKAQNFLKLNALAKFNPIKPKQFLDQYEGAGIEFRSKSKSCLSE